MKAFIYDPDARREFLEAVEFINKARSGYGDEFYDEVNAALKVIRINAENGRRSATK